MSMEDTINRTAKEAYDLVHAGVHPCPAWSELDTGSQVPWITMAKHVLTQGVAIGAMDSVLTSEFLYTSLSEPSERHIVTPASGDEIIQALRIGKADQEAVDAILAKRP